MRLTPRPGRDGGGAGRLTLRVEAAEVGDCAGELDAAVEGPAAEIAFNARYLAEALGAVADRADGAGDERADAAGRAAAGRRRRASSTS